MRLSVSVVLLLLLSACSSKAPTFIVAPQVFWPQTVQLQQKAFSFHVTDHRPYQNTLIIRKKDKQQGYPATNDIVQQLRDTLQQALTEQGAIIDASSPQQLSIHINQLQATINQRPLDHEVINHVVLSLIIQSDSGTFERSYTGNSRSTGPFNADIAAVERELRLLTEQILTQLLRDTDWSSYLQES